MAQIALETLQLQIVNTTGRWPFDRVESAGFKLESKLTKKAAAESAIDFELQSSKSRKRYKEAINRVEDKHGKNISEELEQILSRAKDSKAQGIQQRHFKDCDSIICFGKDTFLALKKLRAFAQTQLGPNDKPLKGCIKRVFVPGMSKDPTEEEIDKTWESIRPNMESFLNTRINLPKWGGSMIKGLYRARQMVIPQGKKGDIRKKAQEIERQSGCMMIKAFGLSGQGATASALVTLVGSNSNLHRGAQLVLACL